MLDKEEKSLVRIESKEVTADQFMPALNIQQAIQRRQAIVDAAKQLMHEGTDFGTIPGTPKPTLLKPGAEKLCSLFGLSPAFYLEDKAEDWSGDAHGGEPFFYFRYKCQLARGQYVMGEGEGSCNSWESKYRYRDDKRKCPQCGSTAIIKGKEEYGGGWLCFAKKGGCGAKFKAGDPAIEDQVIGKIKNPDIADIVNTLCKMAQKRALIAATLVAINASEFWTQDVEDMAGSPPEPAPEPEPEKPKRISETQRRHLMASAKEGGFVTPDGDLDLESIKKIIGKFGFNSSKEITEDKFEAILRRLRGEPEAEV